MKAFNRRNFLKITGVAAAGAAGATLGRRKGELPKIGKDAWPDREERWAVSVCQLCPGGCGVRARVVDGDLVKIDGNPVHPVNRGRLCPVGQAATQLLYHPDRLRSPLARGADGKLVPISWEKAHSILAQRLKALRDRGEAHTAVFLAGTYRGLRERFLRRFMAAYGSPNYIRASEFSAEAPDLAHALTQGVNHPVAPDLFEARSILSFGYPLLEGGASPVYQMRAYGHFRQGEGRPRGVLIHAEARRSATAERADKWVVHRPGTETTLALGIAHALILENLYDQRFVEGHCEGFEDRAGPGGRIIPGFRSVVLREFTLPYVSETTGVPVEIILQVARAFARNQPGVAIGPSSNPHGPARLGLRLAVHFLNALVGNLGKSGGMLFQRRPPLGEWEALKADAASRRSLGRPRIDGAKKGFFQLAPDASERLPERIVSAKPYPVKALLVAGVDPLFEHPRADEFSRAIGRIPFVACFSSMPDAIVRKAHLVLPDAVFLERWSEDVVAQFAGFSSFSLGGPVVRLADSPPGLEDSLLKVAKKIGGSVGESFAWDAFADAILEAVVPVAEAGRGYVAADPIKERFRTILIRQGYWQKEFEDADEFWEMLLKSGAWWDPGDEERGLASQLLHPDGKFHFFPAKLEKIMAGFSEEKRKQARRIFGLKNSGGRVFPADHPPPKSAKGEFQLLLFRPLALAGGVSAELPWMQEQLGPHVGARWDSWAELHPEDAKRLDLHGGELIELRAGAGSLETRVRTHSGVQRGTIAMPVGLGRPEGGRWAKGRGVDPRKLATLEVDPVDGLGVIPPTTVRIRRIGRGG